MADLTLDEINSAIDSLRSAKMARLTGGAVVRTQYQSGSAQKEMATFADIDAEIARLEVLRSRLTGLPTGNGPIRIGFGRRI